MNDTVWCDIPPKDICLVEHFTIAANHECPNVGFPIELLITGNSLTLMPDYIGYGITRDVFHPYLNHELARTQVKQARNQQEIFEAVQKLLDRVDEFMKRYEDLGKKIESQQGSYDSVKNKLYDGNQSVVKAANKIVGMAWNKELGVVEARL